MITREEFLRLEHATHECWGILCERFLAEEEEFIKESSKIIKTLEDLGCSRTIMALSYAMAKLCEHSMEIQLEEGVGEEEEDG